MALRALASHLTYASILHKAGEVIDDSTVLYGGMVAAGARFYPVNDPLIARGVDVCASLRKRGASEFELDDAMGSFVAAALSNNSAGAVAWSPSGKGNAKTWDQCHALIEASLSPVTINLVDRDAPGYEVDDITDLKGSTFSAAPGNNSIMNVRNGAQLRNGGINELVTGMFNGGMGVRFNSTGGAPPPLAWDTQDDPSRFAPFAFGGGAIIQNNGTVPVINVHSNPDGLVVFILANTANIDVGVGPIIHLEAGANMFLAWSNQGAVSVFDGGFIAAAAPGTNFIGILSNGGFDFDRIATWLGVVGATFINNPLSALGGAGTSAFRPFGAIGPLVQGTGYWDHSLVPPRPIFWDGSQFTNALGVGPV